MIEMNLYRIGGAKNKEGTSSKLVPSPYLYSVSSG